MELDIKEKFKKALEPLKLNNFSIEILYEKFIHSNISNLLISIFWQREKYVMNFYAEIEDNVSAEASDIFISETVKKIEEIK